MIDILILFSSLIAATLLLCHHFDFVTFMTKLEGTLPRRKVYVRFTVLSPGDVARVLANAIAKTFKEGIISKNRVVLSAVNSLQAGMAFHPRPNMTYHSGTAYVVANGTLWARLKEAYETWRAYRRQGASGLIVVPLAVSVRSQDPDATPDVEIGRTWRVQGAV